MIWLIMACRPGCRRSDKAVSGHGRHGVSITFPGTEADIGTIVRVRVTEMKNNTLMAERI